MHDQRRKKLAVAHNLIILEIECRPAVAVEVTFPDVPAELVKQRDEFAINRMLVVGPHSRINAAFIGVLIVEKSWLSNVFRTHLAALRLSSQAALHTLDANPVCNRLVVAIEFRLLSGSRLPRECLVDRTVAIDRVFLFSRRGGATWKQMRL